MFSKFNNLYLNILNQLSIDNYYYNVYLESINHPLFNIDQQVLPIDFNILLEASKSAKYFCEQKQQQEYLARMSDELSDFTQSKHNEKISTIQILRLFPDLINYKISPVFVLFFDFSNISECNKLVEYTSNINEKNCSLGLKLCLNAATNGCCYDLRPFGKNVLLLLFNTANYTRRTIYHEWTHYIQKITGDKFLQTIHTIINNHEQTNNLLQSFKLNTLTMLHLTSERQYISSLDNLIFAIKETWKKFYKNNMSKYEFFKLTIDTFKTTNSEILNSQLFNQFINTDKTFKISMQFLIGLYICYKNTDYLTVINILEQKFI